MEKGTVKWFNAEKGFGFIVPTDGSDDLFFHITQCAEGYEAPQEGDLVSYEVGEGRKGPQAVSVELLEAAEEVEYTEAA